VPTPHISAPEGAFADVCLLPGDPLRARYVAEQYLDGAEAVTAVRNMEGYTGTFRGRRLSVMGTGMGIPSASIYATELVRVYGVTTLLRIGSCGAIARDIAQRDVVIATAACTNSNVNRLRFGGYDFAAVADFTVTRALVDAAAARGTPVRVGSILSSDLFYHPDAEIFSLARRMGLLVVEMEAAGLFGIAAEEGVRAGAIMAVTGTAVAIVEDEGLEEDALSAAERQTSLDEMIAVALDATVGL
jgi:purine-nucleoside phosphorylase